MAACNSHTFFMTAGFKEIFIPVGNKENKSSSHCLMVKLIKNQLLIQLVILIFQTSKGKNGSRSWGFKKNGNKLSA